MNQASPNIQIQTEWLSGSVAPRGIARRLREVLDCPLFARRLGRNPAPIWIVGYSRGCRGLRSVQIVGYSRGAWAGIQRPFGL